MRWLRAALLPVLEGATRDADRSGKRLSSNTYSGTPAINALGNISRIHAVCILLVCEKGKL